MSLSRGPVTRWVIDGMNPLAVRYAKSLAAEHGVRIADVVSAVLLDKWNAYSYNDESDTHWKLIEGDE